MKATINIGEDAELRAAVKDMIRGQIKSITREEIREIVSEEVKGIIKGTILKRLDKTVDDEVKSLIRHNVNADWSGKSTTVTEILNVKATEFYLTNKEQLMASTVKTLCDKISIDTLMLTAIKKLVK
ncbi:MAG: hypothetical protein Q7R33_04870 [Nitrosarchaeum sp.]|nr:hypothetical protein [Nitrosarchaeum sp.]